MEGNDPLRGHDQATQPSSASSAKQPCFCRERLGEWGEAEGQAHAWVRQEGNYFSSPTVPFQVPTRACTSRALFVPFLLLLRLSVPLCVARSLRDRNSKEAGGGKGVSVGMNDFIKVSAERGYPSPLELANSGSVYK